MNDFWFTTFSCLLVVEQIISPLVSSFAPDPTPTPHLIPLLQNHQNFPKNHVSPPIRISTGVSVNWNKSSRGVGSLSTRNRTLPVTASKRTGFKPSHGEEDTVYLFLYNVPPIPYGVCAWVRVYVRPCLSLCLCVWKRRGVGRKTQYPQSWRMIRVPGRIGQVERLEAYSSPWWHHL